MFAASTRVLVLVFLYGTMTECQSPGAFCNTTCAVSRCHCDQSLINPLASNDECKVNADCHNNATCTYKDGRRMCVCNLGYIGNGKNCIQGSDECKSATDCGTNAHCVLTDGRGTCVCDEGYTGDGKSCTPAYECRCSNGWPESRDAQICYLDFCTGSSRGPGPSMVATDDFDKSKADCVGIMVGNALAGPDYMKLFNLRFANVLGNQTCWYDKAAVSANGESCQVLYKDGNGSVRPRTVSCDEKHGFICIKPCNDTSVPSLSV